MAERGSIIMDIHAQVSGYEQSLRKLQMEFQKIDPGSQIGKSLSRAIQAAETQVKALNKNLTPRVTNETQIDNVVQKVNNLGESIQTVVRMMQTVTDADLTNGAFGNGIQQFQAQIQSLEAELEGKLAAGVRETIQNFYLLRNTFERVLNIDITDKSPDELLQILSDSAKTVSKDLAKVNKEIENLEANIASKEATKQRDEAGLFGTFASRDQLRQQVEQYTQEYEAIFADLRERLTTGLTAKLGEGTQTQTFINQFFEGLTPDNLKDRITSLYDSLSGLGTYAQNQKRQFYKEIFGFDSRDILYLIQDINLGDPAPVIEKFKQFLDTIASEIGGGEKSKIVDLLSNQDINAVADSTIRNIESAFRKVQTRIQKVQNELTALLNQKANKVEERRDIEGAGISIKSARIQIENELKTLREQNADLQKQIDELNDRIRAEKQGAVDTVHHNAENSGRVATQFNIGSDEIQKYKDQLDDVHQKEQLVGKVEGVVQRWFSIYAAVRMVGNAIRSVISTLKELDATITEIAIVTNMTQKDLWNQMSDYTAMARKYAASISGVYKVSQLYYQQGLQTKEVMELTEQTLKMARISGLDYAEATDYMTNAIRSFKMEMSEAQTVVDVYSAIAAKSATNVTELAEAMSKTASSAESVGSSFQNTTAMMAVMIDNTVPYN